MSIGHLTPPLCIGIMALAGWLSALGDESPMETFLRAFSKGESVTSWRVCTARSLRRRVAPRGSLQLVIDRANVLPVVGFSCLIAALVFRTQHAAVTHSTVVLLRLNPLLIASCSNSVRAD